MRWGAVAAAKHTEQTKCNALLKERTAKAADEKAQYQRKGAAAAREQREAQESLARKVRLFFRCFVPVCCS